MNSLKTGLQKWWQWSLRLLSELQHSPLLDWLAVEMGIRKSNLPVSPTRKAARRLTRVLLFAVLGALLAAVCDKLPESFQVPCATALQILKLMGGVQ